MAIEYFTKWVEAGPLDNIVTRFEIPQTLVSENGLHFNNKVFCRYCCELGITNQYSTPAYPQGNGQAKATNKSIVSGFKKETR